MTSNQGAGCTSKSNDPSTAYPPGQKPRLAVPPAQSYLFVSWGNCSLSIRFSSKTLARFSDVCKSSLSLPQIDDVFKKAGILRSDTRVESDGRRRVFLAYVETEDQDDIRSVVRIADALGFIIEKISSDGRLKEAEELKAQALRDGFTFTNGKFVSAAPAVASFTALSIDELADVPGAVQRLYERAKHYPAEAIGGAKELIETVCYTVLRLAGADEPPKKPDLGQLTKATMKILELVPSKVTDNKKGAELIKILLSQVSTITNSLAQLRNSYGSGHGKDGTWHGLGPRHARLAVGAATSFAAFIAETYQEQERAKRHECEDQGRST